jgi:hypothetical protein
LSDVTDDVDMTFGSLQTEVADGLATRAMLGFRSKVILSRVFQVVSGANKEARRRHSGHTC